MYEPDEGLKDYLKACYEYSDNYNGEQMEKLLKQLRNKRLKQEATKIKHGLIESAGECQVCGFNFKPVLQIHHILPISKWGNNQPENIICVCPNCHKILHHLYGELDKGEDNELNILSEFDDAKQKNITLILFRYMKTMGEFGNYIENFNPDDIQEKYYLLGE